MALGSLTPLRLLALLPLRARGRDRHPLGEGVGVPDGEEGVGEAAGWREWSMVSTAVGCGWSRRCLAPARSIENVHSDDQAILEAIAVANPRVRDQASCAGIVNDLVDVHGDRPPRLLGEALRLHVGRDGRALAAPVLADGATADDSAATPAVLPADPRMHQLQSSIEVTGIEGTVGRSQDLHGFWLRRLVACLPNRIRVPLSHR